MGEFCKRKYTEEQEIEIAKEYVESGASMRELAEKYDVSLSTMSTIIHRSGVIDEMERRADSRTRLALIKLKWASTTASEKLVRLVEKERDDSGVYADIQLIQQILDRAGVRATKEEDNTVMIKFANGSGFKIGETEDVEVIEK